MSTVLRCPSCQKKLRVADRAIGSWIACPACQIGFVASMEEEPKEDSPSGQRSFSAGYRSYCGTRSVIFQSLLGGWTACMIFVGLGLLFLYAGNPKATSSYEPDRTANAGAFLTMGICCPLGMWLLLAVPLGFGALMTLGRDKG